MSPLNDGVFKSGVNFFLARCEDIHTTTQLGICLEKGEKAKKTSRFEKKRGKNELFFHEIIAIFWFC